MVGVQERYAPSSICFGCGPANAKGLRIRSEEEPDGSLVARFTPAPEHHAFPGVVNGGILGTLLDCHMNWTAAIAMMRERKESHPPSTVTASFEVKMRKPTPMRELRVHARVVALDGERATVEGTIAPQDEPTTVTASGRGAFVAVKPGHPAYHRW